MSGAGVEKKPTFCRVCEPACGLLATVEDGRLVRLEPDRAHPSTKGFACPKGLAGAEIHNDPDRLNHPFEQPEPGQRIQRSWDDAIAAIAARTLAVLDRWGPNGIATYAGNPAGFNSLLGTGVPPVLRRLGVRRYFNSGTQDCVNKYAASNAVLGSSYLHPIPDIDHADAILLVGSNWRASKGSFISLPNAYGRLMEAAKRGAKIWFVNPRVTESSDERTGPTVQIVPDTDVYFLAALICEIDRSVGFHADVVAHGSHVEELRAFVHRYPPERAAAICGVDAGEIIRIAREFAAAPSAAAHMSTGVNQGRQGTLAYWLLHMLVFVTGNLGRPGGNVAGTGYYDIVSRGRSDYAKGSLDGEFGPMRAGEIPGGLFSNYVLDADEPVRALFVFGGNPVLSLPGQHEIEKAFKALELLVVIDIYPTATAEHAHWLLPATDQFERADIGVTGLGMQVEPWVQFTDRVVEPQHERREEWWFFARLAQELGVPSVLDEDDPEEAKWAKVDHMLADTGQSRRRLMDEPRGLPLDVPAERPDFFAASIQTPDQRVDCCPAGFSSALERCEAIFGEFAARPADQMRLISRRDSRMHNSWYANVPGMKRGDRTENRLAINPADAQRLGVGHRAPVRLTSEWGSIEVVADHDERIRTGVVSLEHGWGLQSGLRHSRSAPGVNVNAILPHGEGSYDPLSNQQFLTGVPVTVTAVDRRGAEG